MQVTIPQNSRSPIIPLIAVGVITYLNVLNRCADGYCYTYGWPWVAYYHWSDAGIMFDGTTTHPRVEWLPLFGNLLVASIVVVLAWAAHRRVGRAAG